MTSPRHRIVVAIDLAEYSAIVLEHAIEQASRYPACDVHVLHVLEHASSDVDEAKLALGALVLPELDGLNTTDWCLQLHVRSGKAPEEIANLAAEQRAHLLVIGRFGVHHPHRRIGLVAGRVIDIAPCPTLVVGLTDQTHQRPAAVRRVRRDPRRVRRPPLVLRGPRGAGRHPLVDDRHARQRMEWRPMW